MSDQDCSDDVPTPAIPSIVVLDTEHTGFDWRYPERKLISIGLVAGKGHEWYAEVDGWTEEDCSPWVERHVLPLLSGPRLSRQEAARALTDWLASLDLVRLASDALLDVTLMLELLDGVLPPNVIRRRIDLAPLLNRQDYARCLARHFGRHGREHHALEDARAHWAALHPRMTLGQMLDAYDPGIHGCGELMAFEPVGREVPNE